MTNSKPFFSIIIPSLNEEKFLPRLLEDLTQQTNQNFEVIHVDGHSKDATAHLAKNYANRLPTFTQIISPVRNVSHQRNLGGSKASGKYLLFIDADTQLPKYFLEGLSFQLHKDPADIFTNWSVPDSKRATDKTWITLVNLTLEISQFLDSPTAIGVFLGCTPRAFQKIGGFPENVRFGEDEDFVKTGYQKHLSFHIYKEPRFVYSLRRFRKEGTLNTLQQLAAKRLRPLLGNYQDSLLQPKDYAMGGHLFQSDDPNQTILNRLDLFIKDLKNKTLPKRRQEQLRKFLKNLLSAQDI